MGKTEWSMVKLNTHETSQIREQAWRVRVSCFTFLDIDSVNAISSD